jgi:hypothetical protein
MIPRPFQGSALIRFPRNALGDSLVAIQHVHFADDIAEVEIGGPR